MNKSFNKIGVGLLVWSIGQVCSAETQPSPERPNFLIIMADDMGYGDLSLHGGRTPTPHLDKLFESGMVMENFMVSPLCSPTRASLLTGCNPLRINQGPYVDGVLNPARTTFGSAFQQEGYVTGIFGKWHNSVAPMFDPSMPDVNDFGFDEWVGGYGGGFDFFTKIWPNKISAPCWYHNREPVSDNRDYATDTLTDSSIRFMQANRNKNFVCYLPHLAMHDPFHAKMEDLKKVPQALVDEAGGLRSWKEYYKLYNDSCFGGRLQEGYVKLTGDHSLEAIKGTLSLADKKVLYSAMLINLDENIGRLLAYLKQSGLEKNTVVWFFSDNGGAQFPWANNNKPLRGCKATIWEGGIHSRAVVRWPAIGWDVPQRFEGLMGCQDVYPTCMEMAGLSVPNAEEIDGKPCFSAMQNNAPSPVKAYYYLWEDTDVIRTEQWKLIRYWNHTELYDLKADLNETTNVAGQQPERVRELTAMLDTWMAENTMAPGHLPQQAMHPSAEQAHPAPLEVKFTQTEPRRNMVRIRGLPPIRFQTGDQLEYDILFHEASIVNGGHLSLNRSTGRPLFLNRSVDQSGQRFGAKYSYEDARGKWAHRVVGVGHACPEVAHVLGFQLTGQTLGAYHFYLDNIMIHRRDGTTEMIWQKGMPLSGASAPQGIERLQVRAVSTVEKGSKADRIAPAPGNSTKGDNVTFIPTRVNSPEWEGASNDLFQNAVVSGATATFPSSEVSDLFTGRTFLKKKFMVFSDSGALPGTVSYVDFRLSSPVRLNRVTVSLSPDPVANGPDARTTSHLKFYASNTAETVSDHLVSDVAIDPEYEAAYGQHGLVVSLEISLESVQYFRMEMTSGASPRSNGPRVVEIDGF